MLLALSQQHTPANAFPAYQGLARHSSNQTSRRRQIWWESFRCIEFSAKPVGSVHAAFFSQSFNSE